MRATRADRSEIVRVGHADGNNARVARTVTSANSAATKKPLASTSNNTSRMPAVEANSTGSDYLPSQDAIRRAPGKVSERSRTTLGALHGHPPERLVVEGLALTSETVTPTTPGARLAAEPVLTNAVSGPLASGPLATPLPRGNCTSFAQRRLMFWLQQIGPPLPRAEKGLLATPRGNLRVMP